MCICVVGGDGGRFNSSGSCILNCEVSFGNRMSFSENDTGLDFELIPCVSLARTLYVLCFVPGCSGSSSSATSTASLP